MSQIPQQEKLLQLRDKTDRQISKLIHSRLDAGLRFAMQAEYEPAAEILHEAQKLAPVLNEPQRRSLDGKLEELHFVLARRYVTAVAAG